LDGLSVEGASEGPAAAQHGLGVLKSGHLTQRCCLRFEC
jgi:hypothetical protein